MKIWCTNEDFITQQPGACTEERHRAPTPPPNIDYMVIIYSEVTLPAHFMISS